MRRAYLSELSDEVSGKSAGEWNYRVLNYFSPTINQTDTLRKSYTHTQIMRINANQIELAEISE